MKEQLAEYVEKHIGSEYVGEALERYDKLKRGEPIGGYTETVCFLFLLERVKAECRRV